MNYEKGRSNSIRSSKLVRCMIYGISLGVVSGIIFKNILLGIIIGTNIGILIGIILQDIESKDGE